MTNEKELLICYNRGCGKKFDPSDNKEDACQHHPGNPVFHDAYKGWSCCNKKCTDFTEFLSIKGCTKSSHSNVKPPEPPKPVVDKSKVDEVIIQQSAKPLNNKPLMERPPFDSPQVLLNPVVSPNLLEQIKELQVLDNTDQNESAVVAVGQSCKNNACKGVYKDPASNDEICLHHPGVPIFHEGLKFWSCCQKRTTDFSVFLEQPGCTQGKHLWFQKGSKTVKCRMDWYQTATHVFVSIFAKKYNPKLSFIKLNPIHLTMELHFPEENSRYNLDIELRGVADVEASSVSMLPTKVEIKLKKKEPGSWSNLDIPRKNIIESTEQMSIEENISSQVDAVDLSDL